MDFLLYRHKKPHVVCHPSNVHARFLPGVFVWIGLQINDSRPGSLKTDRVVDRTFENREMDFPLVPAYGI